MTTQLDICKMALAEIGARSTITALNDNSTEANYCSLYYASVRDQALRAARWNFAGRVDPLVIWRALPGTPENPTAPATSGWKTTYPAPPWLYAYTVPEPFIYARSVIAQPNDTTTFSIPIFPSMGISTTMPIALRVPFVLSTDPWALDGVTPVVPARKIILTNAQNALFEWTYSQVSEAVWDSEFVMVMVLALATRLAIALTSNIQLAQAKMQSANALIEDARAKDGNESITVLDHMPDWLTTRGVSSWVGGSDFYYPYGPLFSLAG